MKRHRMSNFIIPTKGRPHVGWCVPVIATAAKEVVACNVSSQVPAPFGAFFASWLQVLRLLEFGAIISLEGIAGELKNTLPQRNCVTMYWSMMEESMGNLNICE